MKNTILLLLFSITIYGYSQNHKEISLVYEIDNKSIYEVTDEAGITSFSFDYKNSNLCIFKMDSPEFILKNNKRLVEDKNKKRLATRKKDAIVFENSQVEIIVLKEEESFIFTHNEKVLATVNYELNLDGNYTIKMIYDENNPLSKQLVYFGLSSVLDELHDDYLLTSVILGGALAVAAVFAF
jgi:hypothetical protein